MVWVVLLNWTMIWKCQNCLFVFAFIRLFRSSATYQSINQRAQWHSPIFSEIESLDPKRSSLLSLFILLVSMQTRVSLSGKVCSLFTLLDWLGCFFLGRMHRYHMTRRRLQLTPSAMFCFVKGRPSGDTSPTRLASLSWISKVVSFKTIQTTCAFFVWFLRWHY